MHSSISYANANADTALNIVQDIVLMMNPYNGSNFNSVLCLDNAGYYQDQRIRDAVSQAGGRLLYIPPTEFYNPLKKKNSPTACVLGALCTQFSFFFFNNLQVQVATFKT
ncbi:MAG: hypothetical protein VXW00_16025, partial [Candidatus Latescibacterota bacterium]|nr:hypothetical protein [Candidatus Latescibacterota bacterium]